MIVVGRESSEKVDEEENTNVGNDSMSFNLRLYVPFSTERKREEANEI